MRKEPLPRAPAAPGEAGPVLSGKDLLGAGPGLQVGTGRPPGVEGQAQGLHKEPCSTPGQLVGAQSPRQRGPQRRCVQEQALCRDPNVPRKGGGRALGRRSRSCRKQQSLLCRLAGV